MSAYGYKENAFERQANRKFTFRGTTRGNDPNEMVVYTGEIVSAAGGELFTIDHVTSRLLNGGKDVGRTLNPQKFIGHSRQAVQRKLVSALSDVTFSDTGDPLLREFKEAERKRRSNAAYTEGSVVREPAPEQPKLVFGLEVGDPKLGQIFAAACEDWVQRHAAEFDTTGMSEAEAAAMVANMEINSRSIARLLEKWSIEGKIKVLTHQEVQDARVWLEQRGFWIPLRRQRGVPAGREYFPESEPVAEKAVQHDPRKMSFEELQRIEKARQAAARRRLGPIDDLIK